MYVAKEDLGFTDLDGEERVKSAKQSLHWKLTQCSKVVGVDRSRAVIEEMRKLGIFDNVVAGDVERLDELPLNQKFDIVIAGDIIEHLSNPGRMLDGIKRFCRTNTRVIITTPNAFGAPNYLRYSAGRFREGAEHVMSFNEQNLVTLLKRHGYGIAESHTCFQPRSAEAHNSLAFQAGKSIFKLFPRFGGTLMIIARPNTLNNDWGPTARA